MYKKYLILSVFAAGFGMALLYSSIASAAVVAQQPDAAAVAFLTGANATEPNLACTSLFDIDLNVAKVNNPGKPILWTYGVNFRKYDLSPITEKVIRIYPCLRIYLPRFCPK